jgi:hypothetical protein
VGAFSNGWADSAQFGIGPRMDGSQLAWDEFAVRVGATNWWCAGQHQRSSSASSRPYTAESAAFFNGDRLVVVLSPAASLIQGFINGIRDMVGAAAGAASSVMSAISNFFPHSPAKEGPFSGRGWTPYSGQALVEGFADGMSSRIAYARSAAASTMSAVSAANARTALVGTSAAGASVAGRGSVHIGQIVAPDPDPRVSGRVIGREIVRVMGGEV